MQKIPAAIKSMKKLATNEIKRLTVNEFKEAEKIPVIIVLDNIRSQHNIGSVFRTADAFRLEAIYLCGITATPPNREIQKTALGATESVKWEHFESTMEAIQALKAQNFTVISIEQAEGSIALDDFIPDLQKKYALIYGNEVHGVDDDVIDSSDYCLEIPQEGTKHSLNVSVAAGIVLWTFYRKLKDIKL